MLLRTHLVFNLFLFLLLSKLNIVELNIITFLIVFFATALPDIDVIGSWISKITKPASNLVHIFISHRELLHSLTFCLILFVLGILLRINPLYVFLFSGFYFLHLLVDSLTKSGIRWFWPSKFKTKGFFKTGSILEAILFVLLTLGMVVLVLSMV
ncbi:MAG: metal-dependent hydrolase [Candidatus Pacearchaeota archaeon]|nr:metal-dependent hydrolase [Candidatus Pacearchaeota archaeon]